MATPAPRGEDEPPTEAGTPKTQVHRAARVRTSPSREYRKVPEIDDGRIEGSVEPTASSGVAPSARTAGVEITAPPTPNMPDKIPVTTPTSSVPKNCSAASDISAAP